MPKLPTRSLIGGLLVLAFSGCASSAVNPFHEADVWTPGVIVGAGPFRGDAVYTAGVVTTSPKGFEWGFEVMHAPDAPEVKVGDTWGVLHFAQNFCMFRVFGECLDWAVGGAYITNLNGQKGPGMATKANFHLGFNYRLTQQIRLKFTHHSNGDLNTKECTEHLGDRVCIGENNTGNNFLQSGSCGNHRRLTYVAS